MNQRRSGNELSRRGLLNRAGTLLAGAAALPTATAALSAWNTPAAAAYSASVGTSPAARTARKPRAAYDYTLRETFDEFDRLFHSGDGIGQPTDNNEDGALAWGQSYVLHGFLRMYEAYQDTAYLDRLVENADLVLANRDSERGVTDHRGRSEPAWRAMGDYTAATVDLLDASGQPCLQIRCARSPAGGSSVEVIAESDGLFSIEFTHGSGSTASFEHLTMDPNSADYAVDRIYQAYEDGNKVTAIALDSNEPPAAGTSELNSEAVVFSVHTGMISYPLAAFARLVTEDPQLQDRYGKKATSYLEAVSDALHVHDHEWVTDGDLGYYTWLKGTPLWYDGNPCPLNYTTAMGRAWLELARATGNPDDADYAARIARLVLDQFSTDDGDATIWHYWLTFAPIWSGYEATGNPETDVSLYTPSYAPGSGAKTMEDASHGAITVDFAGLAHEHGVVLTDADMTALARTYTQNLATTDEDGTPTIFLRVDGSGDLAPSGQYLQAPRWIRTAGFDETVFTHCRDIYAARQPEPNVGSVLSNTSALNWYRR